MHVVISLICLILCSLSLNKIYIKMLAIIVKLKHPKLNYFLIGGSIVETEKK